MEQYSYIFFTRYIKKIDFQKQKERKKFVIQKLVTERNILKLRCVMVEHRKILKDTVIETTNNSTAKRERRFNGSLQNNESVTWTKISDGHLNRFTKAK